MVLENNRSKFYGAECAKADNLASDSKEGYVSRLMSERNNTERINGDDEPIQDNIRQREN